MSNGTIRQDSPVPIRIQLRDILLQRIAAGEFPAGGRFPSERELSQRFSVSRASVRETIGELISSGVLFRTVGRGTFVKAGPGASRSHQIAFLISDELFNFVQSGYDRILRGVEESCRQNGDTLLFQCVDSENNVTAAKDSTKPDGFVVVGGIRRSVLERLRGSGTPLVLVDLLIHTKPDEMEAVNIDYAGGTRLAVGHLHRLGHQKIGFIGFAGSEKYEAYWRSLEDLGLVYDPRGVEFLHPIDLEPGILAGFHATQKVLSRAHPPTAILATNDYVARGVIEAAGVAGISVPNQISVVGYDDLGVSASPLLTTVRVDLENVGRLAAEALRRRIQGTPADSTQTIVPVELIERASSGPVKSRS